MIRFHLAWLLLGIAAVASAADTTTPVVTNGTELTPFTIADQNDKPQKVDEDVRVLMFSRDMTANKLAKKAFKGKPSDYLPNAGAMYLIDISGMPGIITRVFAIPKMKKYGYRIFLDHEGELTAALPSHEDQVTIMVVDGLKVVSIDYANDAASLNRAVAAAAAR